MVGAYNMPLNLSADIKYKDLTMPVSYQVDNNQRAIDAVNVFTNQKRLDTRFGVHRFSTYALNGLGFILDVSLLDENYLDDGTISDETLLENVNSVSFYKKADGSRYYIAKAGTVLWAASESGQHTVLKTGLDSTFQHKAVTINDRHIFALGSNGLFSFDGSTFTQLGQASGTVAVTVAASGSGQTLPTASYQVGYTYYASTIGFESNLSTASASVAITLGQQIDVTAISTTADNALINKKRIYVKNVTTNSNWLFHSEIALATTTATISAPLTSTQEPPETNAAPLSGGGKFIDVFGKKIVYSGNSNFPNDIFFSEAYQPDAFDDSTDNRIVFKASGEGNIIGLKTGYYTDQDLSPYVAVFKRRSIEVYSEVGGISTFTKIGNIGCVEANTIQEVNGNLYFMSESGWHIIANGKIIEKDNNPFRLGNGDIDAIFTDVGSSFELNTNNFENFFSAYLPSLKHYLTFVSDSGTNVVSKAYNYEFDIAGFRSYIFPFGFTCGCTAEDSNGQPFLLLGSANGRLHKHGTQLTRTDYNLSNTATDISAVFQLPWISHDDYDGTMNFGPLILKAVSNATSLSLVYFLNYDYSQRYDADYVVSSGGGFILDESYLDIDYLGDNRQIVRSISSGVYKTAQSLTVQFRQSGQNLNIGLLSLQISANKNGNVN